MSKIEISSNFNPQSDLSLFHGEALNLLSQMPDNFVKLIITSPPYNLGKSYEKKLELNEYLDQQKKVIHECYRVLEGSGSICWQVGNFVDNGEIIPLDIVLFPIFQELGLQLRNRIVWQFGHGLHASKRFSGRYEVILWFTKSHDYTFNLDAVRIPQKYPAKKHFKGPKKGELSGNPLGKNPSDVWNIPNVKANHVEKTIHPCQFPVELVERLVLALTNPGDFVFDPYIGVGTSAIAALMHNRKAIGSEIMGEYIDVALDRIKSAEKGNLRIRPIERSVFNPDDKTNTSPPKFVEIGDNLQLHLLESTAEYKIEEVDDEDSV